MSDLDSVLREERVFPPSEEFRSNANLKSQEEFNALYRQSLDDPDTFWSKVALELDWFSPWDRVLDWKFPIAQWLRGPLRDLARETLAEGHTVRDGILRRDAAVALVDEHAECKVDHHVRIWMLLNVEIWYRMFVGGESADSIEEELRART